MMTILLWVIATLWMVPSLIFVVECGAGLGRRRPARGGAAAPPPFAVLMPAHDEARGIARAVTAALAQLRACDRLLVVADNCTDATAAVAIRAGAQVLVRHDPARLGKGHALAAGREALRLAPSAAPAVVIVLDADCLADAGALPLLAAVAARGHAVVQGRYTLDGRRGGSALGRLSTFAFLVKNHVRQRGLQALGGPALLQGTGMAFPWPVFATAPLATSEIVEDLELGLELALAGVPLRFCEAAAFRSDASADRALVSQRTRWEHGSLGVARRYVPRLAAAALHGRPALWPLMLNLLVPPLALLVLVLLGGMAAAGIVGLLGGGYALAAWTAANLAAFAVTVALAWHRFGRTALSFADLLRVPAYLLWKLPIYARLLVRRETRWVRTSRD